MKGYLNRLRGPNGNSPNKFQASAKSQFSTCPFSTFRILEKRARQKIYARYKLGQNLNKKSFQNYILMILKPGKKFPQTISTHKSLFSQDNTYIWKLLGFEIPPKTSFHFAGPL